MSNTAAAVDTSAVEPTPDGTTSGASLTGGGEQLTEHTAPDWTDSLSEDLRGDPSLKDIKSLDELAKGMINAQQMIGSSIRRPSDDASEDAINSYYERVLQDPNLVRIPAESEDLTPLYQKLGMPENAEGYSLPEIEGFEPESSVTDGFKKFAHEIGLTNNQASKLHEFLGNEEINAGNHTEGMVKKGIHSLEKEWGPAFKENIESAQNMAKSFGEDFVNYLNATGQGNAEQMIKLMYNLSKTGMEPTMPMGGRPSGALTPGEAMEQASEIRNNMSHPYNNPMDQGHQAALDKMTKLFEYANPED